MFSYLIKVYVLKNKKRWVCQGNLKIQFFNAQDYQKEVYLITKFTRFAFTDAYQGAPCADTFFLKKSALMAVGEKRRLPKKYRTNYKGDCVG